MIGKFTRMMLENNASTDFKKGRSVRPGFAEDVYGSNRNTLNDNDGGIREKSDSDLHSKEICESSLAQRRSANLPKLKELRADGSSELNISSMECPLASARANQMGELEFLYADSDTYRMELAELYTYSEIDDFALNYDCFVKYMRERKNEPNWNELTHQQKCKILQNVVGIFESIEPEQRLEAARIILYILQGAYGDFADLDNKNVTSVNDKEEENESGSEGLDIPEKWFGSEHGTGGYESDCLTNAALNAYFLFEQGLFQPLCSLLYLESSLPFERHADHSRQSSISNSRSTSHMDLAASTDGGSASGTFERRRSKRSATLADNERIRVVLNCIYHMVETIRREELILRILSTLKHTNNSQYSMEHFQKLRKQFLIELEEPLEHSKTPLLIFLFEMMPSFVRAKNSHYPIKKILLLCWKVLLSTLGGIEVLRDEKVRRRADNSLQPIEDTFQAAIEMRPILNCGAPTGLLSLGAGVSNNSSGILSESENVTGQLGRKVRSIHTVRPFNRQVAFNPATVQEPPNVQSNRVRSNAISEEAEFQESSNCIIYSDEVKKDFEDVNDAIMPASDEEPEENEQVADDNDTSSSDLLDQILEELSSSNEDDERQIDKEEGDFIDVLSSVESATENPKITVSYGANKTVDESAFKKNIHDTATATESVENNHAYSVGCNAFIANALHESWKRRNELLAIQIDRKQKIKKSDKDNTDSGGDQTPKACQSPVTKENPWPPPPPPGLPWKPKAREQDIENFLQNQRQKYFDYRLPNDSTTIFGLPEPLHRSIAALRRNIYISLNDLQFKAEDRYCKYPFSQKEFIEDTPTERLYSRILPTMTEYVIALLKVILASLTSSKAKIDAVTILSDVLTPETDTNEMFSNSISLDLSNLGHNVLEEHIRVAIDINRHKELIIKAASSIIILLLKHFRLNHVYQFENFAQYLVLANCLPLVLKFLDQNICRYFQSKHELPPFNYPQCALHIVRNGNEWPQLTADNVDEHGDSPKYYLWRNVFSSINLLRVINKLTKGKPARIMMLVVYKSAPVLKRCMRAKLGIFQLYVLKLLKLQARYLGRQWRKTNMDLISAIYMRVRHRLNDDWAYANETTRTKSFDFQREENELGLAIKRFNARRYSHLNLKYEAEHYYFSDQSGQTAENNGQGSAEQRNAIDDVVNEWNPKEWEPMDNSLQTALAWEPQFSERFIQNYEQFLEEEVFQRQTDWDTLLKSSRGLLDLYC